MGVALGAGCEEGGTFWDVGSGSARIACNPGRYIQQSVIGEGTYGRVYQCIDVKTDKFVAIKVFKDTHDAQVVRTAKREAHILSSVHHVNIVELLDFQIRPPEVNLVFEYVNKTVLQDLEAYKKAHKTGLPYNCCRQLIWQLVDAVSYLHRIHVIHRDIKPENLLVTDEGILKLCDFGFARTLSGSPLSNYVATRWYRAPELLVGDPCYGFPVDIWAIGCMAAELHTGEALFEGNSDADQLFQIMKLRGRLCPRHEELMRGMHVGIRVPEPDECKSLHHRFGELSAELLEFIQACLTMDPNKRISCAMLQKMSYFCGIGPRLPTELRPAFYERGPAGEDLCKQKKQGPARISINASAVWRRQNMAQRCGGALDAALDTFLPSPLPSLPYVGRPVGVEPLVWDLSSETSCGNKPFGQTITTGGSAAGCQEAPHVRGCLLQLPGDMVSHSPSPLPAEAQIQGLLPGVLEPEDWSDLPIHRPILVEQPSTCTPLLEGCSLRSPEGNDIGFPGGLSSTGPPQSELDDVCAWMSRGRPPMQAPFPVLPGECGSCPSPMQQPWNISASVERRLPEMVSVSPHPTGSEALCPIEAAVTSLDFSPGANTTANLLLQPRMIVPHGYLSGQAVYPHGYSGPCMQNMYPPGLPRMDVRLPHHVGGDFGRRPVIRTGLAVDAKPRIELLRRKGDWKSLPRLDMENHVAKSPFSSKPKPTKARPGQCKTKGRKRRGADEDEELYQSRARALPQPATLRRSQRARKANAPADYLVGDAALESVLGERSPPREEPEGMDGYSEIMMPL